MKKSLLTLMMVFTAMSVFAVDLPKQGFGFQIGWAQPILRLNSNTSKDTLSNTVKLYGLKVGVVYDASYVAGFGSSMGINYTFGAASTPWEKKNMSFSERTKYAYHELELFVDWQYKFEVAKETYLMLYTGPTIQCGLAYQYRTDKRNEMTDEVTEGTTFKPYTSELNDVAMKRINVTWGVGAGFQYKRYFLRGGYDFGLINPYKNADYENGNHTRGRIDQWNIKLGAYLWYK